MIKMKTLTYYWRNELLLVSLRIFLLRYMIGLGFCTCLCYVLKLCLSDLCSSTQCDRICSFCHTLRRIISWNNMFFPNNILPTELCSFRWETVSWGSVVKYVQLYLFVNLFSFSVSLREWSWEEMFSSSIFTK